MLPLGRKPKDLPGAGGWPSRRRPQGELGRLHNDVGEWATARSFLEESLRLERQSNNEYGIALTGSLLGILALLRGEYEPARVHLEENLEILRRLGGLDEEEVSAFSRISRL